MRSWAPILLLMVTVGCSESEEPKPAAQETPPALAVVTKDYEVPEPGPDGSPYIDAGVGGYGRLANVHGCIALVTDSGPQGEAASSALLVWPRGTTIGSDDRGIVVKTGDSTLRVGDEITFGISGFDSLSTFSTPTACEGFSGHVVISRSEPVELNDPNAED